MLKKLMGIVGGMAKEELSAHEPESFLKLVLQEPRCYSADYPNVPLPEPWPSPRTLAAEWTRGGLHAEDMPELAARMLEAGVDTPAVCRLAGEMRVGCRADVEELVGRMFRELGVLYPMQEEEALLAYSRQVAREVIHGKRDAWLAASELERGFWPHRHENPEIRALSELLDAYDWNAVNEGRLAALTAELIGIFARLSGRTEGDGSDG